MPTTITAAQLQQLQASVSQIGNTPTTANLAAAWQLLSSLGDTYASAADQVLAQPTSFYGQVTRNSWAAAGADFNTKFNQVALDHLTTYVNDIAEAPSQNGTFLLPTSTQIESSYYNALVSNGVSPYAAIDLDIASGATPYTGATWYNLPFAGVNLDPSRIGPTAPEVLTMDPGKAIEQFAQVSGTTAVTDYETAIGTNLPSSLLQMQSALQNAIDQALGISGITSFQIGGLTFYQDASTGNLAIFDQGNNGQAFINGNWQNINSSNWQLNSSTGLYQYLNSSGQWQDASNLTPGSAINAGTVASLSSGDFLVNYIQQVEGSSGQPPTFSKEGTFQVADSGMIMTDASTIGTGGNVTATTIQVDAANGTPQSTVQATYTTGPNPTTNVTVTDAANNTQNYTLSGTAGVEDAMDSAANASGSGPTIEVGGDHATLNGGSGQNLLIQLGADGTVNGGSGSNQAFVAADTTTTLSGIDTVSTNNATLDTIAGTSLTLDGSNVAVNAGTDGWIELNGNNDSVGGASNGDTLGGSVIANGTGNTIDITNNGAQDGFVEVNGGATVNGSNDAVLTGAGASLTVNGSSVAVNAGTDGWIELNGNNDSVGGASNGDTLGGSVIANGTGNTIDITNNGAQDGFVDVNGGATVNGSNDAVLTGTRTTLTVDGSSVAVNAGDESNITLDGNADSVGGSTNGESLGSSVTANGSGETIDVNGSSTNAGFIDLNGTGTVNGSSDNVDTGTSTTLTINGAADGVTAGNESNITLDGNNDAVFGTSNGESLGSSVTANGTGEVIDVAQSTSNFGFVSLNGTGTVNGSGDNVDTAASTTVTVNGTANGITAGNESNVTLNGDHNSVGGTSNGESLGTSVTANGIGEVIDVNGSSTNAGSIDLNGAANITGGSNTIELGADSSSVVSGGNNVILGDTGDSIGIENTGANADYVQGSGLEVGLYNNAEATVNGGGNGISAFSGDSAYLENTGSNADYVAGSGVAVGLAQNVSATVVGNGDALYVQPGSSADLTTTYDSVNGASVGAGNSRITETITTNPDGSWVDHLVDTSNQYNWSEEQFFHAANNSLSEETVNYDNGWHTVQYWDDYNKFTWEYQETIYDYNGKIANPYNDPFNNPELNWYPQYGESTPAEVIQNHDGSVVTMFQGFNFSPYRTLINVMQANGTSYFADWDTGTNSWWNTGGGNRPDLVSQYLNSSDWTGTNLGGTNLGDGAISTLGISTNAVLFNPSALADDGLSFFPLDSLGSNAPDQIATPGQYTAFLGWGDTETISLQVDPLVLNLAGGPVTTTAASANGVAFDMRGDGSEQSTGWITSTEGFLVFNRTRASQITNSHDLISDLNELGTFDSNGDGKITASDQLFADLGVWIPGSNGSSGTVQSLDQVGISEIDLASAQAHQADNGNTINSTFSFLHADGTAGQGADVSFAVGSDIGAAAGSTAGSTDALVQAMATFGSTAPVEAPPAYQIPQPPEASLAAGH